MLFVTYPSVQRTCNLSEIVPDILRAITLGDIFVETVFSGVGEIVYGCDCVYPAVIDRLAVKCQAFHTVVAADDRSDCRLYPRCESLMPMSSFLVSYIYHVLPYDAFTCGRIYKVPEHHIYPDESDFYTSCIKYCGVFDVACQRGVAEIISV